MSCYTLLSLLSVVIACFKVRCFILVLIRLPGFNPRLISLLVIIYYSCLMLYVCAVNPALKIKKALEFTPECLFSARTPRAGMRMFGVQH